MWRVLVGGGGGLHKQSKTKRLVFFLVLLMQLSFRVEFSLNILLVLLVNTSVVHTSTGLTYACCFSCCDCGSR